jgi:SNF2 family DNA or RNA helicase
LREVTVLVGMSAEQCARYRGIISAYLRATANNAPRKHSEGLNALMRLRMACNYPSSHALSDSDDADPVARSGKLWALDRLLDRLRRRGASRVVIAVQMTRTLGILEEWLVWGGVATLRVDGDTPLAERVAAVEAFQKGGPRFLAFLLSARVGGIGMDLSAADAVVIVDPDWNLGLERAVVDRVRGQTRPVTVVRLITAGTVEEKLIQMRSIYRNPGVRCCWLLCAVRVVLMGQRWC